MANGISEKAANAIYDSMVDFAKYAFNKSHAAAYAVVSVQTAWLKYYYPLEFMAALMTSVIDNTGKAAEYLVHCRELGISVLPPDINAGQGEFTANGEHIHYGLYAIKALGRPVIDRMIEEREQRGPYTSLQDFISRTADREINKRAIENLIKAGACDCLDGNRHQMCLVYSTLADDVLREKKSGLAGQMSLFDLVSEEEKKEYTIQYPDVPEFSKDEMLGYEKEVLGIYVSGHPLEDDLDKIKKNVSAHAADFIRDEESGKVNVEDHAKATIGGMVAGKNIKFTRNNQTMAFLTIEDLTGSVEVIVFPKDYERYSRYLEEDAKVFVTGRVDIGDERNGKLICERIVPFSETRREVWLQFPTMEAYVKKEEELFDLLRDSDGGDEVIIFLSDCRQVKRLGKHMTVCADTVLLAQLFSFLDEKNVKVVEKSIEKLAQ